MTNSPISSRALRVGIIGSGPSGFYAADALFKSQIPVQVDMFDRLPAPFGLVRYGVAPDHAKIKNVVKVFERIAENPDLAYFGNVTIGKDISIHDLKLYYDALIFCNGAETDRKLGILGEDLPGSHTATAFVAWYNGHPDYRNHHFDLFQDTAVIIGQGNVAMDVARVLCKTVDELKNTDIAEHALEVLATSRIKEVHMVGRRGPVQTAFTPVELKEFGELQDCRTIIDPQELELNASSQKEVESPDHPHHRKNYDLLKDFVARDFGDKKKSFYIQFRKSPVEIIGPTRVSKVVLEENELTGEPFAQKAKGTGRRTTIDCGLFFRSVGYRGLPIKGLPFHDQWGIVPNQKGRVADSEQIFTGLYTSGWIKRGPSGVIGTNKPDSEETVRSLIEDIPHLHPAQYPHREALIERLKSDRIRYVDYADWKKIDAAEIERGQAKNKPREKFVTVEDMLAVIE